MSRDSTGATGGTSYPCRDEWNPRRLTVVRIPVLADYYLEVTARIAGCVSSRTTQLYNELPEEVSLDEIERIHT